MCDTAIGANRLCRNKGQGGLYGEVYFFNYVEDAFTLTGRLATALDGLVGQTVYKYVIQGDSNTFTESIVSDHKTGSKVNTQTLVNQLFRQDSATSIELDTLLESKVSAVVRDKNGEFRWFGEDGINVTSTAEAVTGGASGDTNGYNVTLVAETLKSAPFLDATTVTAFLALVA